MQTAQGALCQTVVEALMSSAYVLESAGTGQGVRTAAGRDMCPFHDVTRLNTFSKLKIVNQI